MRSVLTSVALAGGLLCAAAPGAMAQTIEGGSAGGVAGEGVSASTYGSGTTTTTPDGGAIGVSGGGEASAADGEAATRSTAKMNERRAMQNSTARARDDDERARSRTHTIVRQGETVRSRTTSIYRKKGEKPVHENTLTVTTPEGTTTR